MTVSASDALQYAFSREMTSLYVVILVGWLVLSVGINLYPAFFLFQERPAQFLIATVFLLVGILAVYGGGIALVYKIIADANETAAN